MFNLFPIHLSWQRQYQKNENIDSVENIAGPTMPQIPMLVIYDFKVVRQIEFISNKFSYILRVKHFLSIDYSIEPFSYGDVTYTVVFDENTASRYLGIIGFNVKNRIRNSFRYGAMMLFLPISLM